MIDCAHFYLKFFFPFKKKKFTSGWFLFCEISWRGLSSSIQGLKFAVSSLKKKNFIIKIFFNKKFFFFFFYLQWRDFCVNLEQIALLWGSKIDYEKFPKKFVGGKIWGLVKWPKYPKFLKLFWKRKKNMLKFLLRKNLKIQRKFTIKL